MTASDTNNSNKPIIEIRTVTYATTSTKLLEQLTDCDIDAFIGDDRNTIEFPLQTQYPKEYRALVRQSIATALLEPRCWVVVAFAITEDGEIPVALAMWERKGRNIENLMEIRHRESFLQKSERTLINLQNKILFHKFLHNYSYVNFSAMSRRRAIESQADKKHFNTPARKEILYLNVIGTSSSYRRLGIASKLLTWGIDKAERDGVLVGLSASRDGSKLYYKHGFREIGRADAYHVGDGESESESAVDDEGRVKGWVHCSKKGCMFGVGLLMIWGEEMVDLP